MNKKLDVRGGLAMNASRHVLIRTTFLIASTLPLVTVASAQSRPLEFIEAQARKGTIQSELDYLWAAKVPFSIDLRQVTLKQAFDGIARRAGLDVTYEGTLNGGLRHDVSFEHATLKEILDKLGNKYKLAYRVDGPYRLTIFGPHPS
jgi:hypothetical protein